MRRAAALVFLAASGQAAAQGMPQGIAAAPPAAEAPRGPALAGLMTELEALLGRPLDDPERIRCLDVGQRAVSAARERDHVFLHEVADLLGLAPEALAASPRADVGLVEALLGRGLTEDERRRLHSLEEERAQALRPVRGAYARDLSAATGLPPPAILSVLPKAGL
jgi:hypothetical protein